jgi:DNA-binding Lrp family transcriptional regulator
VKDIELKLIAELMKNARRSDRDLAKVIGISQPTVSRIRTRLEKEGFIKEYAAIPDFYKLGYEILAATFVKLKTTLNQEEIEKVRAFTHERVKKTPYKLVMLERGIGLGYDGIVISLHENYSAYMEFRNILKRYEFLDNTMDDFLIDLSDRNQYLPLTFSVLAKHLQTQKTDVE